MIEELPLGGAPLKKGTHLTLSLMLLQEGVTLLLGGAYCQLTTY